MKSMIIEYLLESSLWMLGGVGLYFLLRRKLSLTFRRFYLLATAILPWILPFIRLNFVSIGLPTTELNLTESMINATEQVNQQGIALEFWLNVLYFIGLTFALGRLMAMAIRFRRLKGHFTLIEKSSSYSLYHTHGLLADSSSFRSLYLDETKSISAEEKELIKKHELVHISQRHSLDNLVIQILLIIFWFHPLLYMIRNELLTIHEFLADSEVVNEVNKQSYQGLLLKQSLSTNISFLYTFNSNSVKKRILELQKKYVPLNPIFLIILVLGLIFFGKSFQSPQLSSPTVSEEVVATEVAKPANLLEIKKRIGYPKAARENGIEGLVVLRLLVDEKGKLKDYRVIKSDNPLLEKAVLKEIHQLEFKAAQKDGKNISMWMNIPFNFKLLD